MILRLRSLHASVLGLLGRDARRLRHVARHPGGCTHDDIALLLDHHGVAAPTVSLAVAALVRSGVSAPVAWAYAMEHDGAELADVLTAGDGTFGWRTDGAAGTHRTAS